MDLAAILPDTHRMIASRTLLACRVSFARRNSLRVSTALAMALILAGCVTPAETPTAVDATTATVSTGDPLIAFVAGAAPGAEGANIGAGMPSRFRLTRSYSAASGAECREVQETPAGGVERLRLVCRDPNGQWREARPLLSNVYSRQ